MEDGAEREITVQELGMSLCITNVMLALVEAEDACVKAFQMTPYEAIHNKVDQESADAWAQRTEASQKVTALFLKRVMEDVFPLDMFIANVGEHENMSELIMDAGTSENNASWACMEIAKKLYDHKQTKTIPWYKIAFFHYMISGTCTKREHMTNFMDRIGYVSSERLHDNGFLIVPYFSLILQETLEAPFDHLEDREVLYRFRNMMRARNAKDTDIITCDFNDGIDTLCMYGLFLYEMSRRVKGKEWLMVPNNIIRILDAIDVNEFISVDDEKVNACIKNAMDVMASIKDSKTTPSLYPALQDTEDIRNNFLRISQDYYNAVFRENHRIADATLFVIICHFRIKYDRPIVFMKNGYYPHPEEESWFTMVYDEKNEAERVSAIIAYHTIDTILNDLTHPGPFIAQWMMDRVTYAARFTSKERNHRIDTKVTDAAKHVYSTETKKLFTYHLKKYVEQIMDDSISPIIITKKCMKMTMEFLLTDTEDWSDSTQSLKKLSRENTTAYVDELTKMWSNHYQRDRGAWMLPYDRKTSKGMYIMRMTYIALGYVQSVLMDETKQVPLTHPSVFDLYAWIGTQNTKKQTPNVLWDTLMHPNTHTLDVDASMAYIKSTNPQFTQQQLKMYEFYIKLMLNPEERMFMFLGYILLGGHIGIHVIDGLKASASLGAGQWESNVSLACVKDEAFRMVGTLPQQREWDTMGSELRNDIIGAFQILHMFFPRMDVKYTIINTYVSNKVNKYYATNKWEPIIDLAYYQYACEYFMDQCAYEIRRMARFVDKTKYDTSGDDHVSNMLLMLDKCRTESPRLKNENTYDDDGLERWILAQKISDEMKSIIHDEDGMRAFVNMVRLVINTVDDKVEFIVHVVRFLYYYNGTIGLNIAYNMVVLDKEDYNHSWTYDIPPKDWSRNRIRRDPVQLYLHMYVSDVPTMYLNYVELFAGSLVSTDERTVSKYLITRYYDDAFASFVLTEEDVEQMWLFVFLMYRDDADAGVDALGNLLKHFWYMRIRSEQMDTMIITQCKEWEKMYTETTNALERLNKFREWYKNCVEQFKKSRTWLYHRFVFIRPSTSIVSAIDGMAKGVREEITTAETLCDLVDTYKTLYWCRLRTTEPLGEGEVYNVGAVFVNAINWTLGDSSLSADDIFNEVSIDTVIATIRDKIEIDDDNARSAVDNLCEFIQEKLRVVINEDTSEFHRMELYNAILINIYRCILLLNVDTVESLSSASMDPDDDDDPSGIDVFDDEDASLHRDGIGRSPSPPPRDTEGRGMFQQAMNGDTLVRSWSDNVHRFAENAPDPSIERALLNARSIFTLKQFEEFQTIRKKLDKGEDVTEKEIDRYYELLGLLKIKPKVKKDVLKHPRKHMPSQPEPISEEHDALGSIYKMEHKPFRNRKLDGSLKYQWVPTLPYTMKKADGGGDYRAEAIHLNDPITSRSDESGMVPWDMPEDVSKVVSGLDPYEEKAMSAAVKRLFFVPAPRLTWTPDLVGMEEAKKALEINLIAPSKRPELAAMGIEASRNVLFWGPPGTGKTKIATQVAGIMGALYANVRSSDILSGYMNDSMARVRMIYTACIENAKITGGTMPAVIFLDECEQLAGKRSEGGGDINSAKMDMIKNELLLLTEQSQVKEPVYTIFATNIPGNLDSAIKDRIGVSIPVWVPGYAERVMYFKKQFERWPDNFEDKVKTLAFIEKLARTTKWFSYRTLDKAMRQAKQEPLVAEIHRSIQNSQPLRTGRSSYLRANQANLESAIEASENSKAACVTLLEWAETNKIKYRPYIDKEFLSEWDKDRAKPSS